VTHLLKTLKGVAALAAATLILAGCGGGAGGTSAGGSADTLNVTLSSESGDFNPFLGGQIGKGQMFDATQTALVGTDDSAQVVGRLADSWEISPDGMKVTIKLKPNLTWSDGKPLTSADVAFSFTRYLNTTISPNASRLGAVKGQQEFVDGKADSISGISTPDESTIVFELAAADGAWVNQLANLDKFLPVLPEHELSDVPLDGLQDAEFFKTLPVGSGPYVLDEWKPGQYAHLVANKNWWAGTPGFKDVYMRVLDSDAAMAQLRTGEVQFISPLTAPDKDAVAEFGDNFKVNSVPGVGPQFIQFNNADALMKDERVRQAFVYAIDREGICKTVLKGECKVAADNIRQLGPDWVLSQNGDLTEYTHDVDKAKALLAEAGWDPATKVVLLHRPGQRDLDNAVNVAQANLKEAGINVEVKNIETANLFEMVESKKGYQMFTIGGGNFTTDPNDLAGYVRCNTRYPDGANLGLYCDPSIDPLFDEGLTKTNDEERTAIYHQIYQKLNQSPDGVVLYTPSSLAAQSSKLENVRIHGNSSSVYWNIGEWKWAS
jgi:peptide/nickel transport system substrate-binding protein